MMRGIIALLTLHLTCVSLFGQVIQASIVTPEPKDIATPQTEKFVEFDPNTAMLRQVEQRWQLWANDKFLKDFGNAQSDAQEALRVVRELQLNRFASIGSERPILEYWLSNGKAPEPGSFRRVMRPIDPASLKVLNYNGAWVLRDKSQILFHFGPHKIDAEQTLAVCQKYGFNQIVYIGQPAPTMIYLVFDRTQGPGTIQQASAYDTIRDAEMLARSALTIPGIGYVGERMPIEVRKMVVRREGSEWVLAQGSQILGRFGLNEQDAHDALRVLRDWRVNEWCKVGTAGVEFFLVNGRAPHGVPLIARAQPFDNRNLKLKDMGGSWAILDGRRVLYDFGEDVEQAKLALKVIQHFQFDHQASFGYSIRPGMKLLVKGR